MFPFLHLVIIRDALQLALPDPAVRPIMSSSNSRPDSYNSKFEEEIRSHALRVGNDACDACTNIERPRAERR